MAQEQGKIIPTVYLEKPKSRTDKAKDVGLIALTIISMTSAIWIGIENERTNQRLNAQDVKIERFAKDFRDEQEYTRANEAVLNKNVAAITKAWEVTGQKDAADLLIGFIEKSRSDLKQEIAKQRKEPNF